MTEGKFRKVWSYTPVDYRTWPSRVEPQEQEVCIKADCDATAIKLLFTNENGVMPLQLADLTITVYREGVEIWQKPICFSGLNELYLNLDENLKSDSIEGQLLVGDKLSIRVILPRTTYLSSGVVTYSTLNYSVNHKTFAGAVIDPKTQFIMVHNNSRMTYFFGIYGLEMLVSKDKETVNVFGDSIVQQGFFANHLRDKLQDAQPNKFGVTNSGIGGNRILFDTDPTMDSWYRHGIAGLDRFERDVFADGAPNSVFVFHGINDIIQETIHPGDLENLDEVIHGLEQYAKIIKAHKSSSLIGTLMPLGNSIFYSDHVEMQRQKMNDWIRQQQIFDYVVDFDQAMKDPNNKTYLKSDYDSGDGLHPSDAGGSAMATEAARVILRK